MPVSVIRGERKPGKKWTTVDRTFALALSVYEADLCHGCGQPMSLSSGDHAHDYDIRTTRCMGCAELEEHRDSSKAKDAQSGTKTFVVIDEE